MTTTTPATAPLTSPARATASAASGVPSPLSLSSLVLGLASIVTGSLLVVPIAGLVLALLARRREPEARSTWLVGLVLNAVMLGVVVGAVLIVGAGIAFLGLTPLLADVFG